MTRRDGIRAFVALGMPKPAQEALERLQEFLPAGRFAVPETMHLTLAFLGTQPEPVMVDVGEALDTIKAEPFSLTLRGVDLVKAGRRGVVWVRAVPDPALAELRSGIRRAVTDAGVHLGRERFRPHVTLARIDVRAYGGGKSVLADFLAHHWAFSLEPFTVTGFRLYRSTLSEAGAFYEALAEYSLER